MDAELVERFVAALKAGDLEQTYALAKAQPELLHTPIDGVSPVLQAWYRGYQEIAEDLLSLRGPPDVYEAAAMGLLDSLEARIFEARATLDVPGTDGHRPLGLAAFFAHEEAVAMLLAAGADPNAPAENAMRVTALHAATAGKSLGCVRRVLEAGAVPDARQQGGYTAIHAAAQQGREDLMALLMEFGADFRARNDAGETPADVARKAGHEPIAMWLEMQPP